MTTNDTDAVTVEEPVDLGARIAELLETGDKSQALELARSIHPADLAASISTLEQTAVRDLIRREFSSDELGKLLDFLDPHYRDLMLDGVAPDRLAEIFSVVEDDIATDAVQDLTGPEAAKVVSVLPDELRESIHRLVDYPPDSAAGRMTGRLKLVSDGAPVGETIALLRAEPEDQRVSIIYAITPDAQLAGLVTFCALLTARPNQLISEITEEVVSVEAGMDQEEAARVLKQYNLSALPVVDPEGRVIGTLTADDLLQVLESEATEDMFLLAGVDEEEYLESVRQSVRYRLPWLYANLLTVLLAAWVVSIFDDTLARVAILAAFLPVVAAQGGNAGLQTVTIVVRSIALGRIAARNIMHVVRHELATGVITGLASALAVGIIAWVWLDNAVLGGLVAVAVASDVLIGVAAGVLIPMLLHTMKQDPALSASIWLTTVTDVFGFFIYLGLATLLIEWL